MERPVRAPDQPAARIAAIAEPAAEHAVQVKLAVLQHLQVLHKGKPSDREHQLALLQVVAQQVCQEHPRQQIGDQVLRTDDKAQDLEGR